MEPLLANPVFEALRTGDAHLGSGSEKVKFFDEQVSPFAGIAEDHATGFDELHQLLPPSRRVLLARPQPMATPRGWQLLQGIAGVQMVWRSSQGPAQASGPAPLPLGPEHVAEMLALAELTKPGPFGPRTIDFGHYHGFFEGGKLVAMTGQRLHVHHFTEVSAVCTHPTHLGKGYASALVQQQVALILQQGHHPFLHVRADNHRAIAVYERLGFCIERDMHFYFLRKD